MNTSIPIIFRSTFPSCSVVYMRSCYYLSLSLSLSVRSHRVECATPLLFSFVSLALFLQLLLLMMVSSRIWER